ncbi:Cro/Cl family transcriptional regulator [Aureimonas endophytica]|uniref:Cro/Cl family transcriptional regulator n=1 Tax=Aureimonas endophytica TaxID=2027858 RepID=A0A916ZWY1_9HYPH|nr:short-chain fatty acyl-CoA regulator family protein [Aureimonas endophytica]GGE17375.1 Cro/Cl family transcriptional regulator [Aureimonas endophytica]
MGERKIFAGPRIRRIRLSKGLSQTAMAAELGISPSYLNLIERNQRPLTVQLLLKLSSVYRVEPEELGEEGGLLPALRTVFADPLIAAELAGEGELAEFAEAMPNAARAVLKLHQAYREQAERLSDLGELLAKEGRASLIAGARLPADELREVLERRPNHFARIEAEAESFGAALGGAEDLFVALKAWLKAEHGIVVRSLPVAAMPVWRRRYDRHTQRLFLSERLSPADQLHETALEAVLLRMRDAITAEIAALALSSDEARRLARFEIGRYAAHALAMPYEPFLRAAREARCDIDVLRSRFRVSFAQAAERLTTLARPGAAGVPFFLLEIDHAGNRLRRAGAAGFPHLGFGGACPKLGLYAAFARPGEVIAEAADMPDGTRFLTVARSLDGLAAGFDERVRRTALLVGCDAEFRDRVVYGDMLPPGRALPIGPVCRLCERVACAARAEPPLTRPLGLDEMGRGLSAFDFQ